MFKHQTNVRKGGLKLSAIESKPKEKTTLDDLEIPARKELGRHFYMSLNRFAKI